MTEQEWGGSDDLYGMLEVLRGRVSDRTLRRFALACCRRIWPALADERSRRGVEVAERFADGRAAVQELRTARAAAARAAAAAQARRGAALAQEGDGLELQAAVLAEQAAEAAAQVGWTARSASGAWRGAYLTAVRAGHVMGEERLSRAAGEPPAPAAALGEVVAEQAALVREIVGNPFRPVAVDPAWLAWSGAAVPRLARAIHDGATLPAGTLDPARLAVLADALEEAGCTDRAVLGHLRGPGPHVRGCWAVALLLDQEPLASLEGAVRRR